MVQDEETIASLACRNPCSTKLKAYYIVEMSPKFISPPSHQHVSGLLETRLQPLQTTKYGENGNLMCMPKWFSKSFFGKGQLILLGIRRFLVKLVLERM